MSRFSGRFLTGSVCLALALFQVGCSTEDDVVSELAEDETTGSGEDAPESVHNFADTVELEGSVFDPSRLLDVQISISDENLTISKLMI